MNRINHSSQPFSKLELDNKKRHRVKECLCGKSNKDGKFVPYVGYEDKGYCFSCGKTFLPEFPNQTQQGKSSGPKPRKSFQKKQPKPPSLTPRTIFEGSLADFDKNHLISFLISKFGEETTGQFINLYHIGTSNCWRASTVFWQIDIEGNIRGGKIMLYNPITGKRVQKPINHFNWMHSYFKLPDYNLEQCFFGEHLLKGNSKPVAIVESEKSAIIASFYLPEYIWLASGGLEQLKQQKCKVLLGRNIVLFPDLGGYNSWKQIATELSGFASITVSDLLEKKATEEEKKQKLDIADYLIKINQEPTLPVPQVQSSPISIQDSDLDEIIDVPIFHSGNVQEISRVSEPDKTENWEHEIRELKAFFANVSFLSQQVKLNQCVGLPVNGPFKS